MALGHFKVLSVDFTHLAETASLFVLYEERGGIGIGQGLQFNF